VQFAKIYLSELSNKSFLHFCRLKIEIIFNIATLVFYNYLLVEALYCM